MNGFLGGPRGVSGTGDARYQHWIDGVPGLDLVS